jgi:acetyl esterase/lipase
LTAALFYGDSPLQVVDVYRASGAVRGVVAFVHGGNWMAMYGREAFVPHCRELVRRGYVAGNVGFRRVGDPGGGFPNTCADVVAALHALVDNYGPLVGVVGHSSGGHLALWSARELMPRPRVVVTVCGMNDLTLCARGPIAERSVRNFTGDAPGVREAADPMQRLPLGTRTVVIAPFDDPPSSRDQSLSYADAARTAGDDVALVEVPGDHMSILDRSSDVWAAVLDAISAA